MAEFITDVVDPASLTATVQEAFTGSLPFEGIIPSRPTDNIRQEIANVDFSARGEVARYRSWNTVVDVGRRPGFSIAEYEIAPLGWSYRLNEDDLERFDRVRQGLGERLDQGVIDVMFNDALNAMEAVENRITLTHAELLTTGAVTLVELGNPATPATNAVKVTFPVPDDQLGVAPQGALWSDHANSEPATDLAAGEAIHRSNNRGRNPAAWGLTQTALAHLLANESLIGMIYPTAATLPVRITEEQVSQALRMLGVRAPLQVIDVERPLLDGTHGQVIDDKYVIGLTPGMARTYFAPPPVIAVMPGNARIDRRDARGIIAYSVSEIRPPEVITTAEAVALPLLERPSELFVFEVLA